MPYSNELNKNSSFFAGKEIYLSKDLLIIGGGAAGFFTAVNAARLNPELKVTIIEKSGKVLSKVKISGGGRCNVTHAIFDKQEMSKKYPRGGNFVKKTFHRFFTTDTIKWFEERGVTIKAEADGRMFPVSDSSQTIIDCLFREANKYKVEILMNAELTTIKQKKTETGKNKFIIVLKNGREITGDYVCIASGGYAKSASFDWLKALGHSIEEPVPSLFTFNMPGNPISKLMGVAVEKARIKIAGTKLEQEGPLLITHWGMSGPAILKLSAWGARELAAKNYDFTIIVNWLPDINEQQLSNILQEFRLQKAAQKVSGKNSFTLPQRLWEYLVESTGIDKEKRWADLSIKEQNRFVRNLCAGEFAVKGKTTFKEEFVTAGGINLTEVDPNTMMSRLVPDLFFAGEVMNVDGITGGFNFQHAWTSGFIAASTIAEKASAV
jgi:predicted Rossmann fold flavoprotein